MTTYTTRNRIIKPAQNEFKNTWGDEFNAGSTNMLDEALDGIAGLALTSSRALTTADGATDEARKRILNITSADAARTLTIPAVEKYYIVRNASSYTITFTVSGGGSTEVLSGQYAELFTDGTNIYRTFVNGWGLYTTTSLTSSTTQTTSIAPNQQFTDMKVILSNVSATTTDSLAVSLKTDAAAGIGALTIAAVLSSASSGVYGSVDIPKYRGSNGTILAITGNAASLASPTALICATYQGFWQGGIIGNITWYWASGGTFDGSGTASVYLR